MLIFRKLAEFLGVRASNGPCAAPVLPPPDGLNRVIDCRMCVPTQNLPVFASIGEFLPTHPASTFIPAALIAQKAKSVSDGIVATLEALSSDGDSEHIGIIPWLSAIHRHLSDTEARERIGAALDIAHRGTTLASCASEILQDPVRSRPLGFYTWNASLEHAFVRDRFLQLALGEHEARAIAFAISRDAILADGYAHHLRRTARLTDSLSISSLEGRIRRARSASHSQTTSSVNVFVPAEAIFPPSWALENLYPSILAFFQAVRTGECNLVPGNNSGFYTYQRVALTALLSPEKTEEARGRTVNQQYREALERLAGVVFFFGRETHVKHLEPAPGAAASPHSPKRVLHPGLTIEPLPSFYRLTGVAFRFLREVVVEGWGVAALEQRQMRAEGKIVATVGEGISEVIALCESAEKLSIAEIAGAVDGCDNRALRAHVATLRSDKDATGDARGMVPLSEVDPATGKLRVAAFLGWESHPLQIVITHIKDLPPETGLDSEWHPIPVPVVREVWIDPEELQDRSRFRALWDSWLRR